MNGRFYALSLMLFLIVSAGLFSQEKTSSAPEETSNSQAKKVEAILPRTNPDLIFVEGEDAVSTNFNREPILNYSCSGFRTLQLQQTIDAPEGSSYFADFVFYAEKDGTYELWYGGTPPGNRNELLPSYASPFTLKLDEFDVTDVYREDMHVAENYAPAYYWNYVKDVNLSAGEHRLSFEIPLRRGYDNKYVFYLDNFFLVRKENGKRILHDPLPSVFPKDPDNRSMDKPLASIDEYQILIRDNPEESGNYIELALVYSLVGDYLNALKNLKKALLLEPDDPDIKLLIAKNLIWKGSFYDGIAEYQDLLLIVPEKLDYWIEAGKIAAWVGQYEDSEDFFKKGLEQFPGNLNLLANLGITYLWASDTVNAERVFKQVDTLVGEDIDTLMELAGIFLVNGYPDKAIDTYKKAMAKHPEYLELYFDLENAYRQAGERNKIPALRKQVDSIFIKTPELERRVKIFYNKQSMKEEVLVQYKEDLKNDPDNLVLRKSLAEMYFWNGYKQEAVDEYLNILTNYTYRSLRDTEKEVEPFLELLDKSYVFYNFLKKLPGYLNSSRKELSAAMAEYNNAVKKLETVKDKNEKIRAKGGEILQEEEDSLTAEIQEKGDKLASLLSAKRVFVDKYGSIVSQFHDDKDYLVRLLEDEKAGKAAFEKLMKGSDWQWDREAMIKELTDVKSRGLSLAGYDLGVINQFEGTLSSAEDNLEIFSVDTNVKGGTYSLFQTKLWMGKDEESRKIYADNQEAVEAAAGYIPDLIEYIDFLSVQDEELFGFMPDDPNYEIKDLNKEYSRIGKELQNLSTDAREVMSSIHSFLKDRMIRGFYTLAENTYLLRNELGDFYQNQKQYPRAIDQYKQVLAIEPWDISAKYKLGQVYQRNGDWAKAQQLYQEVYDEDPVYGNVTAFYNQLAREHADHLAFTGSAFADSSILSTVAGIKYLENFSGSVSFMLNYQSSYNLFPTDPAELYAPTSSYQKLSAGFPLKINTVQIIPSAGFYLMSDLVDQQSRTDFAADSYPLTLGKTFGLYPLVKVSTEFAAGPLYVSGGYGYTWLEETLRTGRSQTSYQEGTGSLQVDFGFVKKPVIQNTSAMVSGYARFFSDSVSSYGIFTELNNSFGIVDKPEVQLGITGSFSWEDSKGTSPDYWVPVGSLKGGGALSASVAVDNAGERSLSDDIRFYGGYYSDDTGSGGEFALSNTFSYSNKDFNGYLQLSGSVKGQFDYWSFTIELGTDAGLPSLLSL